jgi:hypothetical protein
MVDHNNPEAPAAAEAEVSSQPAVSPLLPPAQMWAAIHTRPRCEGKVEKRLKFKQIPVFLPVKNTVRTYGVRVRKSRLPLFTGYLFYDQTKIDRIDVIRTYGVVRIVETRSDPAASSSTASRGSWPSKASRSGVTSGGPPAPRSKCSRGRSSDAEAS